MTNKSNTFAFIEILLDIMKDILNKELKEEKYLLININMSKHEFLHWQVEMWLKELNIDFQIHKNDLYLLSNKRKEDAKSYNRLKRTKSKDMIEFEEEIKQSHRKCFNKIELEYILSNLDKKWKEEDYSYKTLCHNWTKKYILDIRYKEQLKRFFKFMKRKC